MNSNIAKPASVANIRNYANFTRSYIIGTSFKRSLNMVKTLDILTFKLAKYNFNYQILDDNDGIFEKCEEAKTDIINGTIYIKQSIYEEAYSEKYCRANFTIAHEIGHFILHRVLNLISFSRVANTNQKKPYEDPEWQANTFASELLMPYEECLDLNPNRIRRRYHVTQAAAQTRYNKIHNNCN